MKLSREEETFLRHWVHDESHYLNGVGPAKRLQLAHHVRPHWLAVMVAAALPDVEDQEAAAQGPPPEEPPVWPWPTTAQWNARLNEAQAILAQHRQPIRHGNVVA